mmetsp:Transcript_37596/g.118695  ORF Transcript_37596/g.118695 Transcript_37596/m.118695 type:complete len:256 (+) Transcript_37596:35-802(+)
MNDIDKHMNNFNYIIRFLRFFKSFVSIENCKIDNILIYNSLNYAEYKFSYNLIRKLCLRFSDSTKYWHYFSEIQKKIGFSLSKTLKYSLRILKKNPFTLPGIIFTGNLCSDFGSKGYAVSEYLQAYRYEKNSSLINLLISIQYLSSCLNRKNFFSDFSFIIAYSFFFRYINIRRYTIQYLKLKIYKSKLLKSEHHLNKSVFFDIIGLNKNSGNELKKSIYILSRSRNFCLINRKSQFDKFTNLRQKYKNNLLINE